MKKVSRLRFNSGRLHSIDFPVQLIERKKMKATNLTLHSSDPAMLDKWYEEYEFLGRNVRRFRDKVVVYAYPRKPKPKAKPQPKSGGDSKHHERTEQRSKRERWFE